MDVLEGRVKDYWQTYGGVKQWLAYKTKKGENTLGINLREFLSIFLLQNNWEFKTSWNFLNVSTADYFSHYSITPFYHSQWVFLVKKHIPITHYYLKLGIIVVHYAILYFCLFQSLYIYNKNHCRCINISCNV